MDIHKSAVDGLKSACQLFMRDLEAIPEEAYTKSFGAKTRSVADLVFEVNMVNDHIGMVIRGEKPFPWPEDAGWIKAPVDFRSKEEVIKAFSDSSEKAIATAEGFTVEELEGTVQTERGDSSRFDRIRFMTIHLWYHLGQLNYIQTLLGDAEWHWN